MTRQSGTVAAALLIVAAALPAGSCLDRAGSSEPSEAREVTEAERTYADAYCALLERCAPGFGRRWVDETACYRSQITILEGPAFEIWNPDAGDDEILACVDYLDGAACGDFYDLSEFRWTPPCDALFDPEPPAAAAPRPGQPSVDCGACDAGTFCLARPEAGPVCRTCVPGADRGESCVDVPCLGNVGLTCDHGGSDTCIESLGAACTFDLACGSRDYYCDDALGCQPRLVGTPCDRDGMIDADSGDALTCIDGVAALPSDLDGPCEDSRDCALRSLTCLDGTCQPRRRRGEACEEIVSGGLAGDTGDGGLVGMGALVDTTCEGDLSCRGGACADRPGLGEACDRRCQLPLLCVGGACQMRGEDPLAVGDPCRLGLAGLGGATGATPGYCDPETGRWSDYLAPGQQCGGLASFNACGPEAYCDSESGRCSAFAAIGADCDGRRCDPDAAYCGGESVCRSLRPLGAACADSLQCDAAACLGACLGGDQEGLPCTASRQCGGGECAGTCRAERDGWGACGF